MPTRPALPAPALLALAALACAGCASPPSPLDATPRFRANATRTEGAQVIYCAFNVSETPSDFDLPEGNWTPIGAELGSARTSADGRLHLGPWQVCLALKS